MICPGCREYADLPGGCECEPADDLQMPEVEIERVLPTGASRAWLRADMANEYGPLDAPEWLPMGGVVADGLLILTTVERGAA